MGMSKIVYGKRGSDEHRTAITLVLKALCLKGTAEAGCTCASCRQTLSTHPDLLMLNKPSYLVEDVESILSFSMMVPSIADQKVVLVQNMGAVTEEAQNKLLKDIEDNENLCLIGIAYENQGEILDTIKSRTESIQVYPLTEREFLSKFKTSFKRSMCSLSDEDPLYFYYMTSGCFGLVIEMWDQLPIYKDVLRALEKANAKDLLSALHLVKEKDAASYFELYKNNVADLYSFMIQVILTYLLKAYDPNGTPFFKPDIAQPMDYRQLVMIAEQERSNCARSWYNKNDFFVGIAKIAQQLDLIKNRKGED